MSIRFGWTRPQAGLETTDDDQVEDRSSAPADIAAQSDFNVSSSVDARQHVRDDVPDADPSTGTPVTPSPLSPDAVQAIWEVHARVVESERKTHRRIGAAAARRVYHETLVEEAGVLNDAGFENFAAFEAVHGEQSAPGGGARSARVRGTVDGKRVRQPGRTDRDVVDRRTGNCGRNAQSDPHPLGRARDRTRCRSLAGRQAVPRRRRES